MASPIVHSQQGLGLAGLLIKFWLPGLAAVGLGWTLPLIIAVLGFFIHMPLDAIPHTDAVAWGEDEDFAEGMSWDPKAHEHEEVGIWPAFTRNGRSMLRQTYDFLADPKAITLGGRLMKIALADVAIAFVISVAWLVPYWQSPFLWICLGAGAFGTVLPDLILVKPIHDRMIKYNWFWWQYYVHNWLHAPVMKRRDRWVGLIIQFILFGLFAWWAWSNRPPIIHH